MTDVYVAVVAVTVAVHLAFVGYGAIGGFLAVRRPRTLLLHVPVVLWCVAIEVIDFVCPLTALERWARIRAGMAPLPPEGFIAHYLTGVLYPARYEHVVLALVLVAVITSWCLVARRLRGGSAARDVPRRTADATPGHPPRGSARGTSGR